MSVGVRKRFEVFKRDCFTCQYCGRTPPAVILHCDHIIPVSDSGGDEETNLLTSCQDCNLGKSNISLGQVVQPIADRMAEATEKRQQIEAFNRFLSEEREREDEEIDGIGFYWFNQFCKPGDEDKYTFSNHRKSSIRNFLRKMTSMQIRDAADIAHSRQPPRVNEDRTWRYFCGICWKRIGEANQ